MYVKTNLGNSEIHGIGIFAAEKIRKGQIVWQFTPGFDLEYSENELSKLTESALQQFKNYSYISKKTGKFILCFDDARFFNHSDTPNISCSVNSIQNKEDICIANRLIEKGEELTCSYPDFDLGPYEHYVTNKKMRPELYN